VTLQEIEQSVYRDFGYKDNPAPDVSTRVRGYINDRQRRILGMPGMQALRLETGTFATVASTPTYALQMPIQQIIAIRDTTNQRRLTMRGLSWYRTAEPDPSATSGTPEIWVPMRLTPALRAIGGTGLWVVSTSTSDSIEVEVHVETERTNGQIGDETVTLDGTTRVALGSDTDHQRLTRFSISGEPAGSVELYDAAVAGNLVSRIVSGRTNAQFQEIALWPQPSSALTLAVDYARYITNMCGKYDEPLLPADFHYLLTLGAKIDEARKRDDSRWREWQSEYNQGIPLLYNWASNVPEQVVIPGDSTEDVGSNLGSWFPSGRW